MRSYDDVGTPGDGTAPAGAAAPGSSVPAAATQDADRAATYREVFAVSEFRYLFSAYLLSLAGDQLAKVALSVVVFERTGSALLSAVTFAVGYLPWLLGGPLLSVFADRWPRRGVMVGCDLVRMVIVASLALPGVPLLALVGLLFLANLFTPPFEAARSATTPDVLSGDRYAVGLALSSMCAQLAQVGGFLAGGALVVVLSARGALLLDAATFAVSALLLQIGLRGRPAVTPGSHSSLLADARAGIAVVFRTPSLRRLILMLWLASSLGFAPEGLAAPYAAELLAGSAAVGMLLAASPLGLVLGGIVIGRFVRPSRRERLLLPLALLAMVALVPAAGVPWLGGVLLLLFLSGVGFSFIIPLNVMVVRAVDPAARARAFGVVATGLQAVQGLGVVAAGLVAEALPPSTVVTLCGVLGTIAVGTIARQERTARTAADQP